MSNHLDDVTIEQLEAELEARKMASRVKSLRRGGKGSRIRVEFGNGETFQWSADTLLLASRHHAEALPSK